VPTREYVVNFSKRIVSVQVKAAIRTFDRPPNPALVAHLGHSGGSRPPNQAWNLAKETCTPATLFDIEPLENVDRARTVCEFYATNL